MYAKTTNAESIEAVYIYTHTSTFTKKKETIHLAKEIIYLIIKQDLLNKKIGFIGSRKKKIEKCRMIGYDKLTRVKKK